PSGRRVASDPGGPRPPFARGVDLGAGRSARRAATRRLIPAAPSLAVDGLAFGLGRLPRYGSSRWKVRRRPPFGRAALSASRRPAYWTEVAAPGLATSWPSASRSLAPVADLPVLRATA